jgi:hypothetical protein
MKYKIKRKIQKKINSSGKQPCEICHEASILINHHINGRNIPDVNKEWNIAPICDNCHKLVHTGAKIIEGWFLTTDGKKLLWHYKDEESKTGQEATPYLIPQSK